MELRGTPRSMATLCACIALAGAAAFFARGAAAQSSPASPTPAPPSPVASPTAAAPATTPAGPAPTAAPGVTPSPLPSGSGAPVPEGASPPAPTAPPTQPPIIVDPPNSGVTPGGTQVLHVLQVLGAISVTVADPAIVSATADQDTRTITVLGKAIGATTLTVKDDRGLTRDVPVRVAYPAGAIADAAGVRITGNPASVEFVKEQALEAAVQRVDLRPGAHVIASTDTLSVRGPLRVDDVTFVDVPIIVSGEGYFTAQGTTRVRVENFAQPAIRPNSLLVSDYPETLKESGLLFASTIASNHAERFLYYHYNPAGQPDRRVVLRVQNPSTQPALVHFITGSAGPEANEMEVGHLSTERFLTRIAQNEGTVISIAGGQTATLVNQALPAKTVVSNLLQLREIEGAPLNLTLVAQDEGGQATTAVPTALLGGDHPHARGVYPIPEFFFDYLYDANGPDLEIPIGQIPLPNLVEGQTLAGDYGVLQSVTIRMINYDRHFARNIALYANPRGGRATGTFVIDRVLVRAHAMAPFGHYKLRQYTIPPNGFVRTDIVTMPEGGSSYPLRLVVAPDDGSAPPGSSDSPVY